MKTTRIALLLATVFCGYSAFAGDPTITDVTVRQRWPWSKLVDIDYVLSCDDPEQRVDIAVSGFNAAMPLALPLASLSGDLHNVLYGARRIVWDPTATAYTNAGVLGQFNVALVATPVPLYMIVDLTKAAGTDGQIAYVYEADLTNGLWGAWVRNPVTNRSTVVESVVWTGVTTNNIYKTDKLVLRHLPAGTCGMYDNGGTPTELTKAFYAGVFTVTGSQWDKVMGGTSTSEKPKDFVSYDEIRGATNNLPSIDWPTTGSLVSHTNFLGQLRAATGVGNFDLPTVAQWVYLCRAGTTTVYNDGNVGVLLDGAEENNNGETNKYLNVLGAYKFNGSGLQPVGQKAANAWGLYDTHGNVHEWCLDWAGAPSGGIDPVGPLAEYRRVRRGGGYADLAKNCRPTTSGYELPTKQASTIGFRVVWTIAQ